jgi:hypothetical protein
MQQLVANEIYEAQTQDCSPFISCRANVKNKDGQPKKKRVKHGKHA